MNIPHNTNQLIDEAIRTGEIVEVIFTGWPRESWADLKQENFASCIGKIQHTQVEEWIYVYHPEKGWGLLRESIVDVRQRKALNP